MDIYISSYAKAQILRNAEKYFYGMQDYSFYAFYIRFTDWTTLYISYNPAISISDVDGSINVNIYLDFGEQEISEEKELERVSLRYGDIVISNIGEVFQEGKIGIVIVTLTFSM